jgi:hypothetical protein
MIGLRIGIGVVWVLALLAGRAGWHSGFASAIAATSAEITVPVAQTASEVAGAPSMEANDSADPRVDLLGNEIEDAVADYRIDLGGGVYERHSPETAVPKLGSPST